MPLGIHVGDAGSAFPQQWPRTLPPECVETAGPPDAFDDNPDPQSIPPERSECQRYGRMMWVVDDNEDVVYTVRLHPDLFDEVVAGDLVPRRASMRVTGHRELTVSWQPPAVGSAGISGWQVQWREQATSGQTPAAWTVVNINDPSQRSYTIDNLTRGTAYEARVLAVYTDGSTSVHSETAGATAIEQPGQISLKVIPDVGLLALSWNAPSDGGGTITSYQVEHKLATESDYTTVYLTVDGDSPTALTHTIKELENDTRYDVRVRAVNAAGGGDWSAPVTAAPGEQTVLADAKVAADSSGDYKLIELTFNRALDAANLPPPTLFGVSIDNAAAAAPAVVAVAADDDSVVNTVVLTMATEIAAGVPVTVSYTDPTPDFDDPTGVLQSEQGGIDALTFDEEIVLNRPSAPRNLTGKRRLRTDLDLNWDEPEFDGAGDSNESLDYFVQWRIDGANHSWGDKEREEKHRPALGLVHLLESLLRQFGKTYQVRVVAANAAGRGVPSEVFEIYNPKAPTRPTNVLLAFGEATNGYEARLSWDASDFGDATIQTYRWTVSRVQGGSTVTLSSGTAGTVPTADSPIKVGLDSPEAGHVYQLQVSAQNEATSVLVFRQAIFVLGDKGVPESVAAALGSGGLAVSWSEPVNASSVDITGYEIRYKLTSSADAEASWTTVAVDGDDATGHTITGLGRGDHYDVQVRAVIGWRSGTYYGEWSDPAVTADNPYIVDDGVQVTSTRQSAVDTYGVNNIIEFTVTFSEDVAVTGDPVFEFCLGAATEACTDTNALREAEYSSTESSGADVVFTYTVAGDEDSNGTADDVDDDGISALADAVKLDDDVGAADSITGTTTAATAADLSHAALAADSDHKVDGAIVADVVPPMVDSAKVIEDGTKIEIVFNEGLDTNSVPLASAFAVTVDGATSAITPSGVDIPSDDATTVVLSMPTADTIAAGATVTVTYTYTDSDASPLQDLATDKNQVETFTDQAVTNRPAAPTGLTLIPGDDRLEASWTAPTDIGGSTITSYEVQYKPASAPDSDYTTVSRTDPDALTQTITGPTNNTQYTVRVAAVNEAGTGPWSTEESATPETPPAVISALVDIPNLDEIVLTYDKALDTSTSSTPAADAFEVRVDGVAGVAAAPDNVEITNANTVTLTMAADIAAGAEVFVSYTIPVNNKLVRPTGQPAPSFTYLAVLSQPGAPEVSLTSGDTEIIASWPEPALGHGSNPTYEVQYSLDDDDDEDKVYQTVVRDDEAALTETITGLDNNKRYTVRVRVGTDSVRAVSPWSDEMSATPSAVVSAPSGLDLLWGNTKVLVRWIPPADIAGDSSVDGWLVQWRQSGSTEEWSADRQSSVDKLHDDDDDDTADWLSFEKLVDNLTNDTEYEFRVRARVQADRAAEWTADGATATPKVVTPDVPGLKTANLFITSGEAGLTSTTERVTVHFYDEPVRSVVGGLAVYTVRRTFYYASDLSTPAYPLTEVRFEIQLDSTDPPPIRTITTLHAGTGPDDWGGFDYPPSYIDVLSSQFRILWDVLSLDGSTANGDVHDFNGAEGPSGSMVSVIVDQEKAVLEAPVGVDGGLEITWQPLLWAGTALYEYQLCVQWKSGDEDFYAAEDLAAVGTVGIGDRAIILTGDALTDALRAASYTLTGLDNGTTYTVRVAYCNDSNDVRVYPDLISNEVSGTPVDLTAPTVESAKVVEDGQKVEIVFDEDLDSGSTVAADEFGVTVGTATAVNPSGAALSAVDADTVVLTMTAAIAAGDAVTVDYDRAVHRRPRRRRQQQGGRLLQPGRGQPARRANRADTGTRRRRDRRVVGRSRQRRQHHHRL